LSSFEFYHFFSQLCCFAVVYDAAQRPALQKSQDDCCFPYSQFSVVANYCLLHLSATTGHAQKASRLLLLFHSSLASVTCSIWLMQILRNCQLIAALIFLHLIPYCCHLCCVLQAPVHPYKKPVDCHVNLDFLSQIEVSHDQCLCNATAS